jgi:DNA-binding response OmpR family regulator
MVSGDFTYQPAPPVRGRFAGALVLLAGTADRYWSAFRESLRLEGVDFVSVGSGRGAIQLLRRSEFDLVVLGARLPDISGMTVLSETRRLGNVPVIVMTEGGTTVHARGFDLGADDVVARDITPAELARRVEALLRRTRGLSAEAHTAEPYGLVLKRSAHEVSVHGVPLNLTATEFEVLRLLLDHRGDVLSADTISREVWRYETFGEPNFVQAQISRLRAKLDKAGAAGLISTIRGAGYVIR